MAQGIGASGFVGFAFETVAGTYTPPTKYLPVNNETMNYTSEPKYRRPIRQSADNVWAVPGDAQVGGDFEMDALDTDVPYWLYIARCSIAKTGSAPNFTYAVTPTDLAIPAKTASLTIVRNGLIFGYTGCVVSGFRFVVNEGVLGFNVTVLGRDETTQTLPSPTWGTATPYGAGMYNIEIPTGSAVLDTDTFEFNVDDSGEAQFRLKNTGRGQAFNRFGERTVTATVNRDFETKVDYDAFKAVTAQSITLAATKGVANSITMLSPVSIKGTYEVNLSGQGDLLRANIAYTAIKSTPTYTVTIKTQEDITP